MEALMAYRRLIKSGQSMIMDSLAQALSQQTECTANNGRLAVLNFDVVEQQRVEVFHRAVDLEAYFKGYDTRATASIGTPQVNGTQRRQRRLFILEDMPRTFVEFLGSHLRIHLSFFARHCTDVSFLESYGDLPTGGSDIHQLHLPFRVFMPALKVLGTPTGTYHQIYCADFIARRFVAWPKRSKTSRGWYLRSAVSELEACISYWGVPYADGGWDAVLLVDPKMRDRIWCTEQNNFWQPPPRHSSMTVGFYERYDHTPRFDEASQLPPDPACWASRETDDRAKSTFDTLVEACSSKTFQAGDDPFECTTKVRKLVLRHMIDFLNHVIHALVIIKGEPYLNNAHFNSPLSALWSPRTEPWILGQMIKSSRRLDMEHHIIGTLMRNLGIDLDDPSSCCCVEEAEAKQWRYIRNKLLQYKRLYDDTAASQMQLTSLRESQSSNDQARSLGRINLIVSLFVPLSLLAGILSMSGPFGPGGSKFWIFFAIAVPITIANGMFFWTNAGYTLRKLYHECLAHHSKKSPLPLPIPARW